MIYGKSTVFFLLVVVLTLAGCQNLSQNRANVEVLIDGDESFPAVMAGRWKDKSQGWEFVFEPDGSISSAVIYPLGKITVIPGQTTVVPMKKGGKGVYEPGKWFVQYSPKTRELAVEVVMKHFREEMGGGVLEGDIRDVFVGEVSEDYKYWRAEWISYPKYVVSTPNEPEPQELPVDPNDTITELLFEQVADKAN